MRPSDQKSGRRAGAGAAPALALLAAFGAGCTDYKADMSATSKIYDVRVTTHAADVSDCRLIERVDSRDTAKGCGLTVQPTPEECLRYQVKRSGGDTLLMRGPAGEAYDCSGRAANPAGAPAAAAAPPPASAPTPAPSPAPAPVTTPAPASTPVPAPPPPAPAPAEPPAARVRMSRDRESAKGCVYLGDVAPQASCLEQGGEATGDCARQALEAGGDLMVVDGARAQIFSCKARP